MSDSVRILSIKVLKFFPVIAESDVDKIYHPTSFNDNSAYIIVIAITSC